MKARTAILRGAAVMLAATMTPVWATPLTVLGSGSGNPLNPSFDPAFFYVTRGFARNNSSPDILSGFTPGNNVQTGGNFSPLAGMATQDYLFTLTFDASTRLASFQSVGSGFPVNLTVPVTTTPGGLFDQLYIITRAQSGSVQRHIEVRDLILNLTSGASYSTAGTLLQSNGASGVTDSDWVRLGNFSEPLSSGFTLSGTIRTANLPSNNSANYATAEFRFGAVPEPGTYFMIGSGLFLLGVLPQRMLKRRRAAEVRELVGRSLTPIGRARLNRALAA